MIFFRLKLVLLTYILSILAPILLPANVSALSGSDFNAGRIIDDHIFFDGNTMTTQDIQAFLNSKLPVCETNHAKSSSPNDPGPPYTCLKSYQQNVDARPADQYCSGAVGAGVKSAAQIIKDASVACSVSPKVLLVLLQKEQSLLTDTWPWPIQYTKATGYGCPDTSLPVNVDGNQNGCYDDYEGFFNQVWYAARQYQRYAKQSSSFGYRAGQNNYIQYNPNSGCGGTNVFIQNQATAGLYNYTPYQPNPAALSNLYGTGDGCSAYGNRNFWRLYSEWFGSPNTGVCYNGSAGLATGVTFHKHFSKVETPDFQIYSGSSTGCVESHIWNPGFTSWRDHIATVQPSISYGKTLMMYGDLDGGGSDYPIIFGLSETGSGKIESHVLRKDMKVFLAHAASNQPTVDPSTSNIRVADINGDGKDEPILVVYQSTGSGKVELHAWGPGMQSWLYHIATVSNEINPSNHLIEFADIDGNGSDETILVALSGTGSGKIEFHVMAPGNWAWQSHIASNMPVIDPATTTVKFADINGDGRDEAVLVATKSTGSGRVEFHVWNPGFTSWQAHIASNQPATP